MKLFIYGIFLIISLISSQTAAEVMARLYKDTAHPGKCVINPSLILNPGESIKHPDMECARIVCGQKSFAEIHSCGSEISLRNCRLGERKFPFAEYPICCPRNHKCARQEVEQTVVDLDI